MTERSSLRMPAERATLPQLSREVARRQRRKRGFCTVGNALWFCPEEQLSSRLHDVERRRDTRCKHPRKTPSCDVRRQHSARLVLRREKRLRLGSMNDRTAA